MTALPAPLLAALGEQLIDVTDLTARERAVLLAAFDGSDDDPVTAARCAVEALAEGDLIDLSPSCGGNMAGDNPT